MSPQLENPILARVNPERFVGRDDELERLYLHAVSAAPSIVRVAGAFGAGTSETLRQVYDRLFREQRFVTPFYFAVSSDDKTARAAAQRFAYEFLVQTIAFRRNEPALIGSFPDVRTLRDLAPLGDATWARRTAESLDSQATDNAAFTRTALASPLQFAASARAKTCVIIDDLHEAAALDGGRSFVSQIASVYSNSGVVVMLASRRNFLFPLQADEAVDIGGLDYQAAARLVESESVVAEIVLADAVRDLIATYLAGRPALLKPIIAAARDRKRDLLSFRDAAQLYVEELSHGRLANILDAVYQGAAPDPAVRRKLLDALYHAGRSAFSVGSLQDRLEISDAEIDRLTESLFVDEVITVVGDSCRVGDSLVHRDHLSLRYRAELERASEGVVNASAANEFLKRAPGVMAAQYRKDAAVGLRELMQNFDLQEVPRAAIDYRAFRDRYKGLDDADAGVQLAADTDRFALPQFSHVASLADHLPGFAEDLEPERAVVGVGFTDRAYRDEDEIAWLAAEIDSKLEADPEVTREWFDRFAAAANECGFKRYRIWLVAPEGFSAGALEFLAEREAIGSSRRQLSHLREILSGGEVTGDAAKEFEMVVPVGDDTELIAAHAFEEIARRQNYPAKAVNQVKTALVEACINAAEHGLSPDRRIYQKFAVYDDKVIVTVSNRGIRLTDKIRDRSETETEPSDTRRGWGLNLIRTLMDEVRLESVDDGTRIVMTKYMPA